MDKRKRQHCFLGAAGRLRYFAGRYLAVINATSIPADAMADLVLTGKIGRILGD